MGGMLRAVVPAPRLQQQHLPLAGSHLAEARIVQVHHPAGNTDQFIGLLHPVGVDPVLLLHKAAGIGKPYTGDSQGIYHAFSYLLSLFRHCIPATAIVY